MTYQLPEPTYFVTMDFAGKEVHHPYHTPEIVQQEIEKAEQRGRDIALLRMALEALKELWDNFGVVCPSADLIDQYEAAITALRERLGEKV